tara:strand:- start:3 stop:2564 length:2562 start_codon:yes stop_codon:yes gene_type:complete
MSNIKICSVDVINAVKSKDGVEIPLEEVEDILKILESKLKKRNSAFGQDDLNELIKEAAKLSKQAKINAAIEKRNALLNARAYGNILEAIKIDPKNPSRALSAIMVGDPKYAAKGLYSVDAKQHAIMTDSASALAADLHKNDLLKIFQSTELDEIIFKAMFDGPETLDMNVAGVKDAIKIAESIKKVQLRLLKRKNRNGANIGELKNHVVRQMHDSMLLRDAGKKAWIADIKNFIDKEKTFEHKPVNKTEDEFLSDIFINLQSGNHMKTSEQLHIDGALNRLTAHKAPSNLAKGLSGERILHFKDGASSYSYKTKYSRMSLPEAVLAGISHDAQSIGLMETFGPNPRAMFDRVVKDMATKTKGDIQIFDKISNNRMNNQFKELDGTTRARGVGKPILGMNVDFAGISASYRMLQNMAKLGGATISSFSDIATKASFINANTERGIFGSYAQSFSDVFRGFQKKEQVELAFLLNVGVDSWLGNAHARFGANDSGPGMISKAHQMYFRLNGMQWWNSAQKEGLAVMLSADLAKYTNRSFDNVPKETKRLLGQYGITSVEWQLFRGMDMKAVDGTNYLVPALIDDIPSSKIDMVIRNKTGKLDITDNMRIEFKDELRTKLSSYYVDSADAAIPTPGAKERAIMNQGQARGTVLGEAIRMIGQLKGFPITMITKGMTRHYYAKGGGTSGIIGLSQMMVGTTMMGYLSMSLKDIIKGKEPMEVFGDDLSKTKDVLTRAFLQGGGAGIYGDFIFGKFNEYGQSLTTTILGPTAGVVDSLGTIYAKFREGDNIAKDTARFALQNTPYLNLFYAKTALDYFIIYGLLEKAEPGFLRKMESRIRNDNEQEFYFPPSSSAQRF